VLVKNYHKHTIICVPATVSFNAFPTFKSIPYGHPAAIQTMFAVVFFSEKQEFIVLFTIIQKNKPFLKALYSTMFYIVVTLMLIIISYFMGISNELKCILDI